METADQPCYTARLVQPFARLLQRERRLPESVLSWLSALEPDERIPISTVHNFLRRAFDASPDESLGLKAARELSLGDCGALDYAMSSAANLRAAIETAGRYTRLINDSLTLSLEVRGERAIVRLSSHMAAPRAAQDFQLCGLIWNHARVWPKSITDDLDVWFPYPAPERLDEHVLTLGSARLHFGASFLGFGIDARHLESPLRTTDSRLHEILRRHAESEIAALPRTKSLSEQVRELLIGELASGNPCAARISRRLDVSRRTLNRKLEHEGTTFRTVLDDVRKELALRYLSGRDLVIPEIALLTGFSEAAAFHRAFRRWTGQTPSEYRRSRRGF